MKGEILFEKMTNISDEYINEAAMGEAYGNPRRDREETSLSRLLNSGWFVATVCAVISLCVVVALVRWGQAGDPTEPPVGPAGSTPPVSSSRFEFSYELFDAQGNPLTAPVCPGDRIAVKATVINRGLPFLYSGSSWEFCPDVRLIHEGEDKTTVFHGVYAHVEDFGTFLVETGEVGQVYCEVYFPDDAPEGVYDLVLSYKDAEQVFAGVLTVGEKETQTPTPTPTDRSFSFGYYDLIPSDSVRAGGTIEITVFVINEGRTFSFEGDPNDFAPTATLFHPNDTDDNGDPSTLIQGIKPPTGLPPQTCTIQRGDRGNVTYTFQIPEDAREGRYSLTLSYGGQEETFTEVLTVDATKTTLDILQFSFGYEPFQDTTVAPGDYFTLDTWVKNEGSTFTFKGSSMGFVPRSVLRHSKSDYTVMGLVDLPTDYGTVTVQPGEIGVCSPCFYIPADAPEGVYDLVLSYKDVEQVFYGVQTVTTSSMETKPPIETDPPVETTTLPTLDRATEALLCRVYAAMNPSANPDDISVHRYYGTYDTGAVVAIINDGSYVTMAFWSEQVGPADIRYYDGRRILVLYDRIFLTLQEAFDQGALTAENLATIENVHRQYVSSLYSDPDD